MRRKRYYVVFYKLIYLAPITPVLNQKHDNCIKVSRCDELAPYQLDHLYCKYNNSMQCDIKQFQSELV